MYPDSEAITGKALNYGYRDRTYLVTKSPLWFIKRYEDFEKYLDEELIRLGTDHIDIYLLHNLYPDNWERVQKYDGLTFLDKMIEKGKILHKGFSIHSSTEAFQKIADCYDWEMAQIQLNILDEHQQVGIEGLKYGAAKGLAMAIMEPLRGGSLVNSMPTEAKELIAAYPDKRSIAEWCFRWLYNMPEVSVILSGTSTLEQLKDNLRIFEHAKPGVMTEEDQKLIAAVRNAYESQKSIGCTGCRYCMPCPKGVGIPDIFRLYNSYQLTKPNPIDKQLYQCLDTGSRADKCANCGVCMQHCPQELKIPELLKMAHAELASGWK
jgi:predicted aldo/keto reductase-like oxidoreductase